MLHQALICCSFAGFSGGFTGVYTAFLLIFSIRARVRLR